MVRECYVQLERLPATMEWPEKPRYCQSTSPISEKIETLSDVEWTPPRRKTTPSSISEVIEISSDSDVEMTPPRRKIRQGSHPPTPSPTVSRLGWMGQPPCPTTTVARSPSALSTTSAASEPRAPRRRMRHQLAQCLFKSPIECCEECGCWSAFL